MDLLPGSKIIVVDMLETIRLEYQNQMIREINKMEMSKVPIIKHQNGLISSNPPLTEPSTSESVDSPVKPRSPRKPDLDGYYHRFISSAGTFKITNICYYIGLSRSGQAILIQITENLMRIYDTEKCLITTIDKRVGKKQ